MQPVKFYSNYPEPAEKVLWHGKEYSYSLPSMSICSIRSEPEGREVEEIHSSIVIDPLVDMVPMFQEDEPSSARAGAFN